MIAAGDSPFTIRLTLSSTLFPRMDSLDACPGEIAAEVSTARRTAKPNDFEISGCSRTLE
jgi:hypothetical protein